MVLRSSLCRLVLVFFVLVAWFEWNRLDRVDGSVGSVRRSCVVVVSVGGAKGTLC